MVYQQIHWVAQLQLKKFKLSYLQITQYTIKSGSRINRIEITVKLTNPSVLCYKKFLERLKKVL